MSRRIELLQNQDSALLGMLHCTPSPIQTHNLRSDYIKKVQVTTLYVSVRVTNSWAADAQFLHQESETGVAVNKRDTRNTETKWVTRSAKYLPCI